MKLGKSLLSLAMGLTLCATSAKALEIGITDWVGFYPFYLAKEKGFFGAMDSKIKVTYYPDPGVGLSAALANKIDCTGMTNQEGALAVSNRGKIKGLLVADMSYGADIMLVDKSIKSVKDLKGKWVAAEAGSLSHAFLIAILKDNGMTEDDIRFKGLKHDEGAKEFNQGKLSGLVGFPPFIDEAAMKKGKVLVSTKQYPELIADLIWCHKNSIKSKSKEIQALVDGWFKAIAEIEKNPKSSYEIMSKAIKGRQSAESIKGDAAGVRFGTRELNKKWFAGAEDAFKEISDFLVEQKMGKKIRKPKNVFTTEFIK